MRAPRTILAHLATVLLASACVETTPNKAWYRCKDDPCSDRCPGDLRATYCEYYDDDPKCDQCWASDDAGEEAGKDGGVADADGGMAECSRNLDCDVSLPRCASGECIGCRTDADCSGRSDTPACDPVMGACVVCTAAKPDVCATSSEVCREGGGECVQCNTSQDCSAAKPRCGADNTCGSCEDDRDCARFGQVCDTGQCVQCTGEKTQWCNGSICNSKERTCAAGVLPATADLCENCLSDAHCGKSGPAVCLPTMFEGQELGYFCQPKLVDRETCIDDHRPYVSAAVDAQQMPLTSIDGAKSPSCKLALTTCKGIDDYRAISCAGTADDDACGVPGLDDGMCVPVPSQSVYRCSVPCGSAEDCKPGFACSGAGYCSL